MKAKLSQNELQMVTRQVLALSHQLGEIAGSLETRLGESHELVKSARKAEKEIGRFAEQVRRYMAAGGEEPGSQSQTA